MLNSSGADAIGTSPGRRRPPIPSSIAFIMVLAAAPGPATAQAIIIDEDTTLSPEGNPYRGIQVRDGANLTGTDLIIEQGDNSRGLQVIDGNADLSGGEITHSGTTADGIGVELLGGTVQVSDMTVATFGEGAAGFYLQGGEAAIAGGSVITHGPASTPVRLRDSGTFTASNTEIATSDGPGIHAMNSGTVGVTSSTIRSNASSLAASFTETGLIEFILGDGVVATENDGRLLAVSRSGEGGEGQVLLFLEAGSVTSGDIVDEDPVTGSGGTDVILAEGASWSGMLRGVHNFTSSSGSFAFVDEIDITGDLFANGTGFSFSDPGGSIGGNVILGGGATTTGAAIGSLITVGGNVDIDRESVLGGNWAISGNLTNSGRIAPGNPIGRISVDGDLTLLPGSILDMEIDSDDADVIEVGNMAVLDGSVQVTPLAGTLIDTPYPVVNAAGGISGTFSQGVTFAESLPFVEPTLNYEPTTAFVTFGRNDVPFASVAGTSNQHRVAEALDEIASPDPLVSAITFTSERGARQAFDHLSGEIHASTMAALVEGSDHLRNAAINRLRAASGSTSAVTMPMMTFAPRTDVGDAVTIWGGGFGSWTDLDGSDGTSGISTTTGGFVLGADTAAGSWRLGLMAGFSETDIDGTSSFASSTSFHLGAYAGTEWEAIAFRAGLAHSWHDIDADRLVVAGTLTERLGSEYDAESFQAFVELGYRINGELVALEPFVNLAHVDFDSDGYREGDGAAALTGSGGATETTLTTLGLRAETEVDIGGLNKAVLSGLIGWRHAFGDIGSTLSHALPAGDSFRVQGAAIAEDALLLEAGLTYDLGETARFAATTNGQLGSGVEEFGLAAQVGIRF